MATGHVLPSLLQVHGGLDPLFVNHEKFSIEQQESEITSWLKLEDSLPSLTGSLSSSLAPTNGSSCSSSVDASDFLEFPSSAPSAGFSNVKSNLSQLPSMTNKKNATSSSFTNGFNSSLFNSSSAHSSVQPSPTGQYQTQHPFTTNQYNFPTFPGPTFTSFSSFGSFTPQFPYTANIVTATPVNPGSPINNINTASSTPNSPTGSPRYSSPVHSYPLVSDMQQMGNPQFMQLFAQFHQYVKQQQHQEEEEKKKKETKLPVRRMRQPRPKVVEAKGAVQCQGKNRKKGTQCRNAALMEYIGPRPVYCAEHIELDPRSLYEKCKSPYQKEPGDNKGCKEVVLKEFGMCYKHFPDFCNQLIQARDVMRARKHYERVTMLLAQLEKEAANAKKKDGDLYQRKNKLIPKFQEMKRIISKAVESLEGSCNSMDSPISTTSSSSLKEEDHRSHYVSSPSGSESDVSNSSPINGFHQDESENEHSHNGWFINDTNQDVSPKILELSDEDIVDAFADFSDE